MSTMLPTRTCGVCGGAGFISGPGVHYSLQAQIEALQARLAEAEAAMPDAVDLERATSCRDIRIRHQASLIRVYREKYPKEANNA